MSFAGRCRRAQALTVVLVTLGGMTSCSRFHAKPEDQHVYVTAKQWFLRDRVAAVSNRTATVANGDRLTVLDHNRKFLKVRTEKGEVGWIEEKIVATGAVVGNFDTLKDEHKDDPAIASAVVRDEVYLHQTPGRDTEKFYRLAEGEHLKLLRRATLVKAVTGATLARAQKSIPQAPGTSAKSKKATQAAEVAEVALPPAMEDWWLVRDSQGHTGWMLSRMMDVDAPDALVRYAEGQRIVGAYQLTTVNDPEAVQPDKNIPEYVTVVSPYKAGLPYDFEQVRVFTWNVKKHRYETAFRERNIEGYLPVTVTMAADPTARPGTAGAVPAPTFSYRLLAPDALPVVPDPVTGAMVPGKTVKLTLRLEGSLVRRISPPGTVMVDVAHPEPVTEKKKGRKR